MYSNLSRFIESSLLEFKYKANWFHSELEVGFPLLGIIMDHDHFTEVFGVPRPFTAELTENFHMVLWCKISA